jgi:hypothetical protein
MIILILIILLIQIINMFVCMHIMKKNDEYKENLIYFLNNGILDY